jgi:hypothetical protein
MGCTPFYSLKTGFVSIILSDRMEPIREGKIISTFYAQSISQSLS